MTSPPARHNDVPRHALLTCNLQTAALHLKRAVRPPDISFLFNRSCRMVATNFEAARDRHNRSLQLLIPPGNSKDPLLSPLLSALEPSLLELPLRDSMPL